MRTTHSAQCALHANRTAPPCASAPQSATPHARAPPFAANPSVPSSQPHRATHLTSPAHPRVPPPRPVKPPQSPALGVVKVWSTAPVRALVEVPWRERGREGQWVQHRPRLAVQRGRENARAGTTLSVCVCERERETCWRADECWRASAQRASHSSSIRITPAGPPAAAGPARPGDDSGHVGLAGR